MTFRTALITGSSRGIGEAIASRLAQDNYAVAINYASRGDDAEALAGRLHANGARVLALQGDVADAASAAALFDRVQAEWGGLDVLVNNAGVLQTVPLAETSDAAFDHMMNINVRGVFNMLRLAAQRVRAGGAIVNVSSTLVATNLPGYGVYVASKAAVEGFTRVLAKELRGRDITVNAVAPGPWRPSFSCPASPRNRLQVSRRPRRSNVWASPLTSPTWWLSWPVPMAAGCMVRYCGPMAAWPDPGQALP
ncbi:short chain dehydrogenase family protein [Bordetella holmesii 70147]|nr:short chain dehydrogenase family protein [Bordetella holmesii 70147]